MDREACRVTVEVKTPYARPLLESLEPDNISPYEWLRIECREGEDALSCIVEASECREPRKILTLRNTIDDLLAAIKAALAVLEESQRE